MVWRPGAAAGRAGGCGGGGGSGGGGAGRPGAGCGGRVEVEENEGGGRGRATAGGRFVSVPRCRDLWRRARRRDLWRRARRHDLWRRAPFFYATYDDTSEVTLGSVRELDIMIYGVETCNLDPKLSLSFSEFQNRIFLKKKAKL